MFSNKKKERKKEKDRDVYLMPDYWLELSLHPEGPRTGQLDESFPWFSALKPPHPRTD
jgi:hypothetical protein